MSQHSQEIAYLNQLQREEKQRAEHYLQGMAASMDEQSKQAVTDLFADISSRIRVVEEYLSKDLGFVEESFNTEGSSIDASTMPQNDEYKIAIEDLERYSALSSLNYNPHGLPFRLVQSNAQIEKEFPINRKKKMTLAIDIEFSSSEELLENCTIEIDGVELKHKVVNKGKRLLIHIPKGESGGSTHLRIKFPELSGDQKIALSDIYCVPKLSIFGAVAKLFG